ncbi:MAG: sulfur carrier protein ThiS [Phycisphaerales bacterium JB038]
MRIIVNDDPLDLPEQSNVQEMLARLGLTQKPCAVEINKTLVPKRDHDRTTLAEGDRVEIVTLVGGG